jgi:hypothetical protein
MRGRFGGVGIEILELELGWVDEQQLGLLGFVVSRWCTRLGFANVGE